MHVKADSGSGAITFSDADTAVYAGLFHDDADRQYGAITRGWSWSMPATDSGLNAGRITSLS